MSSLPASLPRQRAPLRVGRLLVLLGLAGLVLLVPLVLRVGIVEAFRSEGPSMEPALFDGEHFAVDKSAYGLSLPFTRHAVMHWRAPRAGDVVVMSSPRDDAKIVKRVVGLPGDVIAWRGGQLLRNGAALATGDAACPARLHGGAFPVRCWREQLDGRAYLLVQGTDASALEREPLTVPAGHVYVLGDHRDRSNDSRSFGPAPLSLLVGRALYVYWSPGGELRRVR